MKSYLSNKNRGFTIIELLLVISIISLLSSIMVVSASIARAKALDATKLSDGSAVYKAFEVHLITNEDIEIKNHLQDGSYVEAGGGNQLACEDMDNPESPTTSSGLAYNRTMQTLVDSRSISGIPHSKGGQPYCVFNYGRYNDRGFVFATGFAAKKVTTDVPNTCTIGTIHSCPLTNADGDANSDQTVGSADLTILSQNYDREDCSASNSWCEGADFNRDGSVSFADLVKLAQNYGQSCVEGSNLNNICTVGADNGEVCWCHPY